MTRTRRRRWRPRRSNSIGSEPRVYVLAHVLHGWPLSLVGIGCRLAVGAPAALAARLILIAQATSGRRDKRCQQDTRLVEPVERNRLEQERDGVAGQEGGD